ncbi:MAG: hypothetical protein ACTSXL_00810, partial [Alphaproteobacteria bacterium]
MRTEDKIRQLQYKIIKQLWENGRFRRWHIPHHNLDSLYKLRQELKENRKKLKNEKLVYSYIDTTYNPDTYLVLNFNKGLINRELANNLTREFFRRYYQKYIGKHWYKKSNKNKLFNFCITEEVGKSKNNTHHNILLNRNGMDLKLLKMRVGAIANETGIRLSNSTNNNQSKTIHIQNIYTEDDCFEYCLKEIEISVKSKTMENLID